jgi:hypothetical protein
MKYAADDYPAIRKRQEEIAAELRASYQTPKEPELICDQEPVFDRYAYRVSAVVNGKLLEVPCNGQVLQWDENELQWVTLNQPGGTPIMGTTCIWHLENHSLTGDGDE